MDSYGLPQTGDVQVWWPTDMIGNGVRIAVGSVTEGLNLMKAFEEYDKAAGRTCYVESVVPAEMFIFDESSSTKDRPFLGTGWVEWKKVANLQICSACSGTGWGDDDVCNNCSGKGRV